MNSLARRSRRPEIQAAPEPKNRLAVVDAVGQVWTHPDPLYLYHWLERRNDLLRNLQAATRLRVEPLLN